jgi:hypothetical protein
MSKRKAVGPRVARRRTPETKRGGAKKKAVPVTKKPEDSLFVQDLPLSLVAWLTGKAIGVPITTQKVAGAIKRGGLKDIRVHKTFVYDGVVISRQQTVVHHSQLLKLQELLEERWA